MKRKKSTQPNLVLLGVVALVVVAIVFGYLQKDTTGSEAATSPNGGDNSLAILDQRIKAAKIPPVTDWTFIPKECSALYESAMDRLNNNARYALLNKWLSEQLRLEADITDAIAVAIARHAPVSEINWLYRKLAEVRKSIANLKSQIKLIEDQVFAEFRKCVAKYSSGGIHEPTPPGGIILPEPSLL